MVTNSALAPIFTSNNWDKKPWILLLLFYIIPNTQCEPHSLSYYYTGMSQSGILKGFRAMTYVDDQEIMTCNQKKYKCRPVASWMKDKEDDSYWEKEEALYKWWEKAFNENLLRLKHWFNNTNGLIILQLRYGCEIQNDGDIKVHYRYGFQGRDYSLYDTFSLIWDPIMYKAKITAWTRIRKSDIMESVISYLNKTCPEALNTYIGYGRDKLEWKVPPKVQIVPVKVTDRVIRLRCLVYGFHPRAVDVKWVRNGVDNVPSDEMSPILPHPDGTYQIRVSAEMPKREEDTYSCHVDHSSLEEEIAALWDPKKNNLNTVVRWIICFAILAASVGFFCIILLMYCHEHTEEPISESHLQSKDPSASSRKPRQTSELPFLNPFIRTSVDGNVYSKASLCIILHNKDYTS